MHPYNSVVGAQLFVGTGTAGLHPAADQRFNVMEVPHAVDVSAMEVNSDVVDGLAADATHIVTLGVEDGGATGVGTTDIDTPVGGTGGWTADTPKPHTMSTSASDLDVDDWINFHYDEGGTPGNTGGIHVGVNFVFGIPGGIA